MKWMILSLALVSPPAAEAKDFQLSCLSTEKIDETAQSCEDNEAFASAAVNCLDQLQELVDEEVEAARKSLAGQAKEGKDRQDKSFKGAAAAYGISLASIEGLLKAAHQAKDQVNRYFHDMYYPEEIAYAEAGMDFDEILLQSPCFSETQNVIVWVEEDVYGIIDDLEAAKAAAGALKKDSQGRETGIRHKNAAAPKLSGKSAGPKVAPAKAQRASDISGTKKGKE